MPPTRRLIVNADDFGQSPGINRGILQAYDQGILTSASAMVRWPAIEAAAHESARRSRLSVGLHVDLGEWMLAGDQWVPIYEVVSLTDESAIAAEIERQHARFCELFAREPTHLDSHQHVHRREPVRSILRALAARLAVPLRHESAHIQYCGKFYGQDAECRPIPGALTVEALSGILERLPEGTTELACHPAEICDIETIYGEERLQELAVLCDPRLRNVLAQLKIKLCPFSDLDRNSSGPVAI